MLFRIGIKKRDNKRDLLFIYSTQQGLNKPVIHQPCLTILPIIC